MEGIMEIHSIIWEEMEQRYYRGKVGEFVLFYIFKQGVDNYILETLLPVPGKLFKEQRSVVICKKLADRILISFLLNCIK